jgi:hypothetical protein
MAPVTPTATATMLGLAAIYLLTADQVKVRLLGSLGTEPASRPPIHPQAAPDEGH